MATLNFNTIPYGEYLIKYKENYSASINVR
jgi:hypothetical protein